MQHQLRLEEISIQDRIRILDQLGNKWAADNARRLLNELNSDHI